MKTYLTARELRGMGVPQKAIDRAANGQYRNQVLLPRENSSCTRRFKAETFFKYLEEGRFK